MITRRQTLAAVSSIVASGCIGSGTLDQQNVRLIDQTINRPGYSDPTLSIEGRIKNVSGEVLDTVSVEYKFYNRSGSRVASASDMVSDLNPGVVWEFEATCLDCRGHYIDGFEYNIYCSPCL